MTRPESPYDSLAARAAAVIREAFDAYQSEFRAITQRAKDHFEKCDWHSAHDDAVVRLELYKKVIDQTVLQIDDLLREQSHDKIIWKEMKSSYTQLISCCTDYELAETFFNSVTRRIFATVGVDPDREFVDSDFEPRLDQPGGLAYHTYRLHEQDPDTAIIDVIGQILLDHQCRIAYQDLPRDLRRVASEIQKRLQSRAENALIEEVDIIHSVFYRGKGAYLVGRMKPLPVPSADSRSSHSTSFIPLVLCLLNEGSGVFVDAVLLDEDEVSILFSFTRSYFHVEVDRPHELVDFLKSIMPLKPLAELFISIGYNKHGKTELYRDLIHHLENSTDRFEIARGDKGMVMTVFTMPSYDVVFKVIKDRIDPPKTTTRQEVMRHYDLVFKHDRAGRLVDAQEFEHLSFDRGRFTEQLLAELQAVAPSMVTIHEDSVSIKHLYTERRLSPLNLYIKEVDEETAHRAVIDYGQAIKDLAATNIFPGDVLLKNFGVTRHGRVVFYDYDELCQVTDCKFRRIPQARNYDDELSADPWFYVGPLDIFPEEFRTFLGLQEPLRSVFIQHHGDLFGVEFWIGIQSRHRAGEVIDIFPYPEHKRLGHTVS